jgi:hypothetical protein
MIVGIAYSLRGYKCGYGYKYSLHNGIWLLIPSWLQEWVRGVVVFDEGFEAGQGGVPLLRDGLKIGGELVEGFGVEGEDALAAGALGVHEADAFEDAEVLGDGLAGEVGALGELGDGAAAALAELGEQLEAGLVA